MNFMLRVINYITKRIMTFFQYISKQYYIYRKIGKINKRLNRPRVNGQIEDYKKKWSQLSKFVMKKYYKVYSELSGKEDINYVPENIFYTHIEPILNEKRIWQAYVDKNMYDSYPFCDSDLFPDVVLRNIHGAFYDSDYKPVNIRNEKTFQNILENYKNKKILIKPSIFSHGGRKIKLFRKEEDSVYRNKDGNVLNLAWLDEYYSKNYVLQEYIEQHPFYNRFNPSSINTVRVVTYRSVSTEKIAILHTVMRVGGRDNIVDNASAGGMGCGIDSSGILNDFALDYEYNKQYSTPSGVKFKNVGKMYRIDEMKEIAKKIARNLYYQRIVCTDFCVDKDDNIRIIEINNNDTEINGMQMNNGAFFGEYTDEVIEYCKSKKGKVKNFSTIERYWR